MPLITDEKLGDVDSVVARSYVNSLEKVFDLAVIESFCSVEFSNGKVLPVMRERYPGLDLKALSFSELSHILGARVDQTGENKVDFLGLSHVEDFDFISCMDINFDFFHKFSEGFLTFLKHAAKDVLILGWETEKSSGSISSRSIDLVRTKLIKNGFDVWIGASADLRLLLKREGASFELESQNRNIIVYRKQRYLRINSKRFVQGTATDSYAARLHKKYPGIALQKQVIFMRNKIIRSALCGYPLSILRFGDGDLYFVNAVGSGSARPGSRALKISYSEKKNLPDCRAGLFKTDYIVAEIDSLMEGGLRLMLVLNPIYLIANKLMNRPFIRFLSSHLKDLQYSMSLRVLHILAGLFEKFSIRLLFFPILYFARRKYTFNKRAHPILKPFPYTFECVYALVASRMIFKAFPSQIMLVGQREKLAAIQELCKHKVYREYIGIETFCGYVGVEKIGAADNEDLILDNLRKECLKKNPKLILIGIGSAKLYTIPKMREFTTAVVVDIGAGIDALAGVVSQDRPYFADWVNFKSKNIDYDSMDMMDANNPARDSDRYKKINLTCIP